MIMNLTWAALVRAGDGNRTRMTSLEGWWHILAAHFSLLL